MVVCQCGTQTFPWALPGGRFYNGGKNHYHSRVRWQRRVSAPVLKEHGKGGERRERGRGNHNLICEEFNACQWCRAVSSIITAYPLLLQCSSLEKFRGEKNIRSENIFSPLTYWPSFVIKTAHKNLIRESIVYFQFPVETCCRAP